MEKRLVIVATLLMFGFSAIAQYGSIRGNGNVVKTKRNVSSFDKIDVGGSINVFLTQSNRNEILIEADENLHDIIVTKVEGDRLIIKNKENVRESEKFNVYVTFENISSLSSSGSTDVVALSAISAKRGFNVSSSGASDMLLKKGLSCTSLSINGSGSSDLTILKVESSSTDAQVSGSVDLEIEGNTDIITINASGSSDISARDYVANNVSISTTGSSDVYVHASNNIMVNASGSSDVYYWGDPTNRQIKASRSADVTLKQ